MATRAAVGMDMGFYSGIMFWALLESSSKAHVVWADP